MKLLDYIPIGRENAISMPDLSVSKGITPRECRRLVQREREKGAPICSDFERGGYFLPADKGEALRYYRAQLARIKTARAALNGVRAFLKGGVGND